MCNPARVMDNLANKEPESGRLLSVGEFASAIGKTERQVYRYVRQGRVISLEGVGRGLRIPESEITRFLVFCGSASGAWSRIKSGVADSTEDEAALDSIDEFESIPTPEPTVLNLSKGDGTSSPKTAGQPEETFAYQPSQAEQEKDFVSSNASPTPEPKFPTTVPLERHEAAVMRLGYMQSRLEQVQRLLTDGRESEKAKEQQLHEAEKNLDEAQREILRLSAKIEAAEEHRREAENRANQLAVRLEAAEQKASLPWWKRIFNS